MIEKLNTKEFEATKFPLNEGTIYTSDSREVKIEKLANNLNEIIDQLNDESGFIKEIKDLDYNKFSHTHCWLQLDSPACNIPLEKHTQCCLCDEKYNK